MSPQCRQWVVGIAAAAMCGLSGCITTSDTLGKKDNAAAAEANMQLGINAMQLNNMSEAKAKIDRALAQDSRNAAVHYVAGILYARINEVSKADGFYSAAISLEPQNADYTNGYAVFLCAHRNYAKGEKLAVKAADNPLYKSPQMALFNAGNCALDDGRPAKAEEYYRRALTMDPKFARALFQLADLELKSTNYLSARGFLERYHQYAPTTSASLWLGVRIERGLGNTGVAQNYARRLKEEFSGSDETKALLNLDRQ